MRCIIPADLTINKSHAGNFIQGQAGAAYTITVSNSGGSATSGTVTVTDFVAGGPDADRDCGDGLDVHVDDARPAPGTRRSPPARVILPITVTVNVAGNAPASLTNTATVSGGGDTNSANNAASDVATVGTNIVPDLTITASYSGAFVPGQTGGTYAITVTNSGSAGTFGAVTVTDTLPASLTATAMAGPNWDCSDYDADLQSERRAGSERELSGNYRSRWPWRQMRR